MGTGAENWEGEAFGDDELRANGVTYLLAMVGLLVTYSYYHLVYYLGDRE